MELVEPIRNEHDIRKIACEILRNSTKNYLIFMIGINTGLRVSDILGLDVETVKDKDKVFIREKKTNKYKQFPLNEKLKSLIKEYIDTQEYNKLDEPLFTGDKGSRLHRSMVYKFLNEACENCNIKMAIGTHTMRKTFGYHFYKKFKDVAMLQKIFNHSSPDITLRYIGITQDEIDNAYMNFEL